MIKNLIFNKTTSHLYMILIVFVCASKEYRASEVTLITRHFTGDIYTIKDKRTSNGEMKSVNNTECRCFPGSFRVNSATSDECSCQCHDPTSVFREDLMSCVATLQECSLVSFGTSGSVLHFHIEHNTEFVSASDEIMTLDVNKTEENVSPLCIIMKGRYMTTEGWKFMDGSSIDVPLRIIPASEKITFQWTSNPFSKRWASGRLLLINLLCKNAATSSLSSFEQCVTFRVGGNQNLRETVHSYSNEDENGGSTLTRGVVTGIGLLLASLTFCYLMVSFFYFRLRKHRMSLDLGRSLKEKEGLSKKSSVNSKQNRRVDAILSKPNFPFQRPIGSSGKLKNKQISNGEIGSNESQDETSEDEIYSIPSPEEEIEGKRQRFERLQRDLRVSSKELEDELDDDYDTYEATPSALGLAIVETAGSVENVSFKNCAIEAQLKGVPGTKNKRRLFFSPSYFEPEMLQTPPVGALEFLSSVRTMMSVAKQKIQMKSFQPTLIDIPEDYGHLKASNSDCILGKINHTSTIQESDKENFLDEDNTEINIYLEDEPEETNSHLYNKISKIAKDEETSSNIEVKQSTVDEIVQNLEWKLREKNGNGKQRSFSFCAPRKNWPPSKKGSNEGNCKENTENKRPNKSIENSSGIKRNWSFKENKDQLKSSVENIRQEIQSKLNRVSSLTRIQSFKKNKKDVTTEGSPELSIGAQANKNKVNRWLHSIEIPANDRQEENTISNKFASDQSGGRLNDLGKVLPSATSFGVCNEDYTTFQKDNEVSIIDISTHFYEKGLYNVSNENRQVSQVSGWEANLSREKESNSFRDITSKPNISPELQISRLTRFKTNNNDKIFKNDEENSYEEILYKDSPFLSGTINTLNLKSRDNSNSSLNYQKKIDQENNLNFFDSSLSTEDDVIIPGQDSIINRSSNNFLCIELSGDSCKDVERRQSFSKGSSKQRCEIKRNDSMVQDSLERPKVKKKLNYEEDCNQGYNSETKDLYTGLNKWNLHKPEKNSLIKRSKTMKTFKDYKEVRFLSSKGNQNKLTFLGEGINLNYTTGKSIANEEPVDNPPPIPPKHTKYSDTLDSDTLQIQKKFTSNVGQDKPKIRYSNSFTPLDHGGRPKQMFHIYGEGKCVDSLKDNSISRQLNNFDKTASMKINPNNIYNNTNINGIIDQFGTETQSNKSENIFQEPTKNILNLPMMNQDHVHNLHNEGGRNLLQNLGNPRKYNLPKDRRNNNQDSEENANYSNEDLGEKQLPSLSSEENEREINECDRRDYLNITVTPSKKNNLEFLSEKRNKLSLDREDSFTRESSSQIKVSSNQITANIKKCKSITRQPSFKKKPNFIQRSVSLHRLAQGGHNASGASTVSEKKNNSTFSVYINDSFSIDD